jgi:hypothetical protein
MDSESMVSYTRPLCLMMLAAAFALSASAKSPIYRCIQDGQTVLTDKPCEGSTTAPSSGTAAAAPSGAIGNQVSAPESVVGDWRGQTQFQGAQNGVEIEEAHSVVPLVLTFSADGKVSGVSADNGCTLLGLWAPGVTPRLFTLDITLSDCRYAGLNRRYSGTVTTAQIDQSARLELMVYTVPIPGSPIRRYDVGATLRR